MRPEVPQELRERAALRNELTRSQRSELGKMSRRLGLMQSEIRAIVPVPKAALSFGCRNVQLTPDQIDAIRV